MTIQIIRNQNREISIGQLCRLGSVKKTQTIKPVEIIEGFYFLTTIQNYNSDTKIDVYFDGVKDSTYSIFGENSKHECSRMFKNGLVKKGITSTYVAPFIGTLSLNNKNQPLVDFVLIGEGKLLALDAQTGMPLEGENAQGDHLSYRLLGSPLEGTDAFSLPSTQTHFTARTVNMTIGFVSLGEIDFVKTYASDFTIWDLYRDMKNAINSGFGSGIAALTTDSSNPDLYYTNIIDDPAFNGCKIIFSGNQVNDSYYIPAKNTTGEDDIFYVRYPDSKLDGEYAGDSIFGAEFLAAPIKGVF